MAASALRFLRGRCIRAARIGAWACLATLITGLAAAPSKAANLAPPTLTAWQRSLEGHLTIEWAETVRVQQKRIGDRLILRFARPLGVEIAPALRNLSNFVDPSRTTVDGSNLSLALKPGVSSKIGLREKRIVAVDFFRDTQAQSRSRIEASTIKGGVRLTMDWPGPTRIASASSSNELRLEISPAWEIDPANLADLQRKLRPWFHDVQSGTNDGGATMLSFVLEPQIAPSVRSFGPSTTVVDLIRDASELPTPVTGAASHVFIPARRPGATTASANVGIGGPPIPKMRPHLSNDVAVGADTDETAANRAQAREDRPDALVIDWEGPVGAAIFIRAGHLWAVFDQPDASLLSALSPPPAAFGPGSIVPADGGTALRFPLAEAVNVGVERTTDGQWRISPRTAPSTPRPAAITRDESSAALRVAPGSGERVVSIIDPTVGDRIDVLPMRDPGIGQPNKRRFVELELLPTVQGLAWRPLSDQLVAEARDDGLFISSPQGLKLSTIEIEGTQPATPTVIRAVSSKQPQPDDPPAHLVERPAEPDESHAENDRKRASYLDLAGSEVERTLVGEYRRIRRQAISKAAPEERDKARIDLARLLVAERLANEARTVLNTISDDAESDVVLQKRALSGVAAFLIGHLAEASSMLLDPDLTEDDEMDIWRAALQSMEEQWQTAANHWQAASDTLDSYPPRLKFGLGLMALEAAIETNDDGMMQVGVRRLTSLPLNPYDQARLDAMMALKAERAGDLEKAQALLTGLADSPNSAVRTLADFQRAALDLEAMADDPPSLAALDRRMPLWRGHPDESAILDKLAKRYRDVNALRRALTTWRRLIRLYPETADGTGLNVTRQETFMQALANTTEPLIDPHEIYAIYLDFRDLLPGEAEARTVHRQLARYLVDLDLLDQAIDVLQPLMASATDDLERAELASIIATQMLRLDRPAPALDILDSTDTVSELPTALDQRRRLIGAEALAKLGRTEDALLRLRDLSLPAAQRLQAEILWEQRRWPRLAAVIESYFADADLTSPLAEEDQELVMWLALARQSEGTSNQLKALRERFRPSLTGSAYAASFDVATQSSVRSADIQSLLAATEGQLAEFQRFRQSAPAFP